MSKLNKAGGNGCLFLVGAIGALLVAAGLAYDHWPQRSDDAPPSRGLDLPPPPPPIVVEPAPAPPPMPAPAPIPTEPLEVTPIVWHAEVLSHPDVASGTDCAVVVELNRRLDGPAAVRAIVRCPDQVLFDGLVGRQDLSELSLGDRGFAYRASVSALGRGVEHGQSSLTILSASRRAAITAPGRTIELYIDDLSVPRRGAPFFVRNEQNRPRAWPPVRRSALVRDLTGPVPAALTQARNGQLDCALSVRPAMSRDLNCRVVLRCGAALIYGAAESGYNRCEIVEGRVESARDEGMSSVDTDPDITLSLRDDRLLIADDGVDGVWSATLRLTPDPACEGVSPPLDGQLIGVPARSVSLVQRPSGWTLQWDGDAGSFAELTVNQSDCDSGELAFSSPEGDLELTRGFDGRTLGGYWIPAEGPVRAVLLRAR